MLESEKRVLDALGGGKAATFKSLQKKTGLSRVGLLAALLRLHVLGKIKIEFMGGMYIISKVP